MLLFASLLTVGSASPMAKHTILLEAFYDGDWHAVPTSNRDEVRVTSGRQDQLQRLSPSEMTVTINNRDGVYSPRNPESPLYGKIGRNTRVRLTVDGGVEFVGEVESWPVRWDKSGQDKWVRIVARGPLYRLGLPGSSARALSALEQAIAASDPFAYWALDDGPLSKAGLLTLGTGNAFTAAEWGTGSSVEPGSNEVAPWLGPGLQLSEDIVAQAGIPTLTPTTRVTLDVAFLWTPNDIATGVIGIGLLDRETDASSGSINTKAWVAQLSDIGSGQADASLAAADEGSFPFTDVNTIAIDYSIPHHLRMDLIQNGADIDAVMYLDGVSVASGTLSSRTLTSFELNRVRLLHLGEGGTAVFTDIALWVDMTPLDLADAVSATEGYAGEQAHERIERVCALLGIAVTITGDESERMGFQPVQSPLETVLQSADVDMGVLREARDAFGLEYVTRASMYNLDPTLTLTYGQGEVAFLEPSEDLDLVQNDVTVTRPGGSRARSVQETGPLNVQEPVDDPQGVGRFAVGIDVNVAADGQLAGQAAWRRHVGTTPDVRVPMIRVDLDALAAAGKTALVTAAAALAPGDLLRVTNAPMDLSESGVLDLHVQGTTRTFTLVRRLLEINSVPYSPYDVGTYQDTPIGEATKRYDTLHSTLTSDVDAGTDTAISVTIATGGSLWTTNSASWVGLQVEAGGVIWDVTSITGTSSPQTINVTATAANGVVKTVPAGTQIRVAPRQRATRGL
jgi:hypothetical protein